MANVNYEGIERYFYREFQLKALTPIEYEVLNKQYSDNIPLSEKEKFVLINLFTVPESGNQKVSLDIIESTIENFSKKNYNRNQYLDKLLSQYNAPDASDKLSDKLTVTPRTQLEKKLLLSQIIGIKLEYFLYLKTLEKEHPNKDLKPIIQSNASCKIETNTYLSHSLNGDYTLQPKGMEEFLDDYLHSKYISPNEISILNEETLTWERLANNDKTTLINMLAPPYTLDTSISHTRIDKTLNDIREGKRTKNNAFLIDRLNNSYDHMSKVEKTSLVSDIIAVRISDLERVHAEARELFKYIPVPKYFPVENESTRSIEKHVLMDKSTYPYNLKRHKVTTLEPVVHSYLTKNEFVKNKATYSPEHGIESFLNNPLRLLTEEDVHFLNRDISWDWDKLSIYDKNMLVHIVSKQQVINVIDMPLNKINPSLGLMENTLTIKYPSEKISVGIYHLLNDIKQTKINVNKHTPYECNYTPDQASRDIESYKHTSSPFQNLMDNINARVVPMGNVGIEQYFPRGQLPDVLTPEQQKIINTKDKLNTPWHKLSTYEQQILLSLVIPEPFRNIPVDLSQIKNHIFESFPKFPESPFHFNYPKNYYPFDRVQDVHDKSMTSKLNLLTDIEKSKSLSEYASMNLDSLRNNYDLIQYKMKDLGVVNSYRVPNTNIKIPLVEQPTTILPKRDIIKDYIYPESKFTKYLTSEHGGEIPDIPFAYLRKKIVNEPNKTISSLLRKIDSNWNNLNSNEKTILISDILPYADKVALYQKSYLEDTLTVVNLIIAEKKLPTMSQKALSILVKEKLHIEKWTDIHRYDIVRELADFLHKVVQSTSKINDFPVVLDKSTYEEKSIENKLLDIKNELMLKTTESIHPNKVIAKALGPLFLATVLGESKEKLYHEGAEEAAELAIDMLTWNLTKIQREQITKYVNEDHNPLLRLVELLNATGTTVPLWISGMMNDTVHMVTHGFDTSTQMMLSIDKLTKHHWGEKTSVASCTDVSTCVPVPVVVPSVQVVENTTTERGND